MNGALEEWVARAEEDAAMAQLAADAGHHASSCFHAQQAIEKYLKALLVQGDRGFPRTHALPALVSLAAGLLSCPEAEALELGWLTDAGVESRYPGEGASRVDARKALAILSRWRPRLRQALKLPE